MPFKALFNQEHPIDWATLLVSLHTYSIAETFLCTLCGLTIALAPSGRQCSLSLGKVLCLAYGVELFPRLSGKRQVARKGASQ